MIDYSKTYEQISKTDLGVWVDTLKGQVDSAFANANNGDLPKWLETFKNLPDINPSVIDINSDSIVIGKKEDADSRQLDDLESRLRTFCPWRKGPYELFGLRVDTEWRSDMKWNRLKEHITPLKERLVLDVGSGNGYHCWRMAGEGAELAIGVDPTWHYVMQFNIMQKYINNPGVSVLPLGIDDMPKDLEMFDTVFSMGLLYHRRAPFEHIMQLRSCLRDDGELVLETLVIDGKLGDVLSPSGRYAKMPNVWFVPSCLTLEGWLKRMHFKNIRLVDVTRTTSEEQRVTDWIGSQSLSDFLDPDDPDKTIEGYSAPKRAIFLANK